MKSKTDIKEFIKRTVAAQLPLVEPRGIRDWIADRITEPYEAQIPVDPEGTQIEDFWIVTDHKGSQHYRIAYSTSDEAFGIVTTLESGQDWYMGDYGTFKEAAERL